MNIPSGPTLLLSNGAYVDLLNPIISFTDITAIAHSLSQLCRFTGHTSRFYSVAQHSMLVAGNCPALYLLEGLLHDAAEAFIGDVATPFKECIREQYSPVEERLNRRLAETFDLSYPWPESVRKADLSALRLEREQLLPPRGEWDCLKGVPLPSGSYGGYGACESMDSAKAESLFLDAFWQIVKGRE